MGLLSRETLFSRMPRSANLARLCLMMTPCWCFLFDPQALGGYLQTEIAPAVTFDTYQAPDFLEEINLSFFQADLKESVGFKDIFTLDLFGSYAVSIGGSGFAGTSSAPTRGYRFEGGGDAYFSIALDTCKTIYLEPAIGYGWLGLSISSMQDGGQYQSMQNLLWLNALGPKGGFYFRILPADTFSIRCGGMYQISRLCQKYYDTSGNRIGTYRFDGRRSGLSALCRFDYIPLDWVSVMFALEYRSWSASSSVGPDPYPTSPFYKRIRLAWGTALRY